MWLYMFWIADCSTGLQILAIAGQDWLIDSAAATSVQYTLTSANLVHVSLSLHITCYDHQMCLSANSHDPSSKPTCKIHPLIYWVTTLLVTCAEWLLRKFRNGIYWASDIHRWQPVQFTLFMAARRKISPISGASREYVENVTMSWWLCPAPLSTAVHLSTAVLKWTVNSPFPYWPTPSPVGNRYGHFCRQCTCLPKLIVLFAGCPTPGIGWK